MRYASQATTVAKDGLAERLPRYYQALQDALGKTLTWNPWQGVFLRLVQRLHGAWLC